MSEIQYIGEHLWIGNIGHFTIILSFVASILSAVAYSFDVKSPTQSGWKTIGRIGFILHGLGVFVIIGILFYAMMEKYYEYAYVYQHVSDDLPLRYTLSAFWEGQEGSFLLWMFWHAVLGIVIIFNKGKWESPIMSMIAIAEFFLGSMLLGLHIEIGDWMTKFGSNPMLLLRDTMQIPIFENAEYLSLISGTGLNPLLQNYWMTIHPPITFLGFASTIVPFGFAIAGLWTGKYKEWLQAALPWALFSAGILGTGILMGSVWAYEALSFGGFWSWDPVENAVLVPWLTLVAGLHTHLIARSTGYSIKATFFFYIISFPLIVYSTFLTRSGILGDTSAHAFTEMGLEKQLVAFFMFFFIVGLGLLIYRNKNIPTKPKEESIYSREFWMFMGSLVLLFSAILIGIPTSFPVFNSLISYFDENYIGRVIQDPVPFYNKFQLWIAVLIAIISAISIFLRYNESNWSNRFSNFYKRFSITMVVSVIMTFVLSYWLALPSWQYWLFAIAGFFAIISNLDYLVSVLKGNLKLGSSVVAHLGFGVMLIGLLGSGLNQYPITSSPWLFKDIFQNEEDLKELVMVHYDKPLYSLGYWITYESDTLIDRTRYYKVNFRKVNEDNETIREFTLYPDAVYSNDFQKVASFNPDVKHDLDKDIWACIRSLAPTKMDVEQARMFEDSLVWDRHELLIGDTLRTDADNWFVIKEVNFNPSHSEYVAEENDFGVEVQLVAGNNTSEDEYQLNTALGLQGALLYKYPQAEENMNLRVRLADDFMDQIFSGENILDYKDYKLPSFGSIEYEDLEIKLTGFDKAPENRNYQPKEGDIAVGAEMMVVAKGKTYQAKPIFIIRDNNPMGVKAYVPELGLHIRFTKIDPAKEEFTFNIARDQREQNYKVPIEITEKVGRSDYIVLQATIFPGINLLWGGCILMMVGLFMAMIVRMKQKLAS